MKKNLALWTTVLWLFTIQTEAIRKDYQPTICREFPPNLNPILVAAILFSFYPQNPATFCLEPNLPELSFFLKKWFLFYPIFAWSHKTGKRYRAST